MGLLTAQGADGRNSGDVQPVAGSVAGSPFTSGGVSAATPSLTGLAVISVQTNAIHARFTRGGDACTASHMLLPVGIHRIPCNDHIMTFLQEGAAATVYVELAREVSP